MPKYSMPADEQEAIFRRWLETHLGLIMKVVRGCAPPQDQDDGRHQGFTDQQRGRTRTV